MTNEGRDLGLHARISDDIREEERERRMEEEERRNRAGARALPAATLALAIALICAAWYAYPILKQQGLIPAQLLSMQDTLAAAGKRLDAADQRLTALVDGWGATSERMTKIETKVNSDLRAARKQTQEFLAQMQQRVRQELDGRLQSLDARVKGVEAGQESEQVRVARIERELTSVRAENARQIALLQQEKDRGFDRVDHQLAGLGQQMDNGKQDLAAVRTQIDRRRVDFEAGVNHSRELAPGITLQVSHANVGYQRFGGYVSLMPDRRTIWVKDQGVQRPLVFYSRVDSRPRELVITRVTKYSVIGYLLLPSGSEAVDHSSPVS